MKLFICLLFCTILPFTNANLQDGKNEIRTPKMIYPSTILYYVEKFWETATKLRNRKYKRIWQHQEPGPLKFVDTHKMVRGNNVIEDIWWSFYIFMGTWDENSWWTFFSTFCAYFLIPLAGGYAKGQAHQEYKHDPATLQVA